MLTADSSLWRLVAVASEHQCKPTWASLAGENFLKSWIWLYFKNCGRPDLPALTHSGPCQTLSNRNISRINNLFLLHKIFITFLTWKITVWDNQTLPNMHPKTGVFLYKKHQLVFGQSFNKPREISEASCLFLMSTQINSTLSHWSDLIFVSGGTCNQYSLGLKKKRII